MNQLKLINFFRENLVLLKNKATAVEKIEDEIIENERGPLLRSFYRWKLNPPIKFFEIAEQSEFNSKLHVLTLSKEKASYSEMRNIVKELVLLTGTDINHQGNLKKIEPSILNHTIMRLWSFDKKHENIKEYPPESEGYMICLLFNKKECILRIMGVLNLYK